MSSLNRPGFPFVGESGRFLFQSPYSPTPPNADVTMEKLRYRGKIAVSRKPWPSLTVPRFLNLRT